MPPSERKRPWYLVLALLAALVFGANGARSGWGTVALYHEPINAAAATQGLSDEADRAAVVSRVEAYLHVLDAEKARGWPLGVATLLLGTATLFFAMRAFGGSSAARAVLVQLVLAQAGVNVLTHVLTRDILEADLRVLEASEAATIHEQIPDAKRADETMRTAEAMFRIATPLSLAMHLFGSALVVFALTRPRARAFFDPAAAAVRER
ncbi:MAG TPA: hypothetical protein VGM06_18725 [Polyangiaceae bacterium]|jgi:hypothetical protein